MERLLALFNQVSLGKTQTAERCPIITLPEEIILLIADHVALHDRFLLSHTCRAMRKILFRDWKQELLCLSSSQRIDLLMGIAYDDPNRWVCAKCCKLHPADSLDHPLVRRVPFCIGRSRRGPLGRYYLEHHHIQLSLKLSRLGINRSYLKRLLASCTHTVEKGDTVYTHAAQPKIIEGRFVLFEKLSIGNTQGPISNRDMEEGFVMLCPHLALPRSYLSSAQSVVLDLCPSKALDKATTLALRSPGKEMQGSCDRCPTDYSVLFTTSRRELTFCSWSDFGTFSSAPNPDWRSPVWENDHHRRSPNFCRALGGTRDLYVNDSS